MNRFKKEEITKQKELEKKLKQLTSAWIVQTMV